MKRLVLIALALSFWPAGHSAALPGHYSLEAYTGNGKRPFAGYYTYYQRIYDAGQVRYLHRATRRRLRHMRKLCGPDQRLSFRLSRRNLAYIRSHRRRGHRIYVKRYLGYRRGIRRFQTLCQI